MKLTNKILVLIVLLTFISCSKMKRFERSPIVIEFPSQLADADDGFEMIAYNSGKFNPSDRDTYRRWLGKFFNEFRLAGKEVWQIDFFDDNDDDLDPTQEVTFLMFSDFSEYNGNMDIDFIYSEVSVDNLKPGGWYDWVFGVDEDEMKYVGKTNKIVREYENNNDSGSSSSNPLIGKWMNSSGCSNQNGERDWFEFNSNGTGRAFAADCNSACGGILGIMMYFNYTSTSSELSVTYTSGDPYCGINPTVPTGAQNATYSISGNTLTIDGQSFIKQ